MRTRVAALAGCVLTFAIPNEPHPAFYALPEIACDLVTAERDQWRCDEDPVTFQRFAVRPRGAPRESRPAVASLRPASGSR